MHYLLYYNIILKYIYILYVIVMSVILFTPHITRINMFETKRHLCLDTKNIQVTLTRGHQDSMEISGAPHPGLLLPTLVSHPSWPDAAIGGNPEIVHP